MSGVTWREFIASLVASLAWPSALICFALVFRERLLVLLAAPIKRLKVGPAGLEFEQWENGAAVVAQSVVAAGIVESSSQQREGERLVALAATVPEAAVLEAFALVEQELREIAVSAGVENVDRVSAAPLAEEAAEAGAITLASVDAIKGLATLRDLAAVGSGEPASAARAVEYVMFSRALLYALRTGRRTRTD